MDSTEFRRQFGERVTNFLVTLDASSNESTSTRVSYGTAGFRGPAEKIRHLLFNVGIICGLRSLHLDSRFCGLMITASHNPIEDNGVKLVDSNGEMLDPSWEGVVEDFCNLSKPDEITASFDKILGNILDNLKSDIGSRQRIIIIGHDTRPSCKELVARAKEGLRTLEPFVGFVDYGEVTTPILHYLVAESNKQNRSQPIPIDQYFYQLSVGLDDIFKDAKLCKRYNAQQLAVDCANGVGYEAIKRMIQDHRIMKHLHVEPVNIGDGVLNHLCGADYVKTKGLPPINCGNQSKRYASMDGDADRIVYFYLTASGGDMNQLRLIDGDKIMSLYAIYLKDMLKKAGLDSRLTFGVIQTAYANGSSTEFLTDYLRLRVDTVDTGVKNLHNKALEYDLAVYFEANGHGTIWVSDEARTLIYEYAELNASAKHLKQLLQILVNYTGDAISNLLIVESILRHRDWSVVEWYDIYKDRPNSLIKVQVDDKDLIKTTNAGRTSLKPEGLQEAIDEMVRSCGLKARCFVRPSGTENVVRIYAEADDQQVADHLVASVGERVRKLCKRHIS